MTRKDEKKKEREKEENKRKVISLTTLINDAKLTNLWRKTRQTHQAHKQTNKQTNKQNILNKQQENVSMTSTNLNATTPKKAKTLFSIALQKKEKAKTNNRQARK